MQEAEERWQNFTRDRAIAGEALRKRREELADMQRQMRQDETEFDEKWRQEKEQRRLDRDDAVRFELKHGKSPQRVLREIGSKNTVWMYRLRQEVESGWTPPQGMNISTSVVDRNNTTSNWQYHDFTGTHTWAISEDRTLVKKHGVIGTPDEGCYFIAANGSFNFVSGDKDYYEKVPESEFYKRVDQLESLLKGTYQKRIKTEPNPYKELDH